MVQLSVIVPAWNEAEVLQHTLPELHAYLKTLPYTFELIVADDGSTDHTKNVVEHLRKKLPGLHHVGYKTNKGKGGTLNHAFSKAKGDYQAFIDADLTIDKTLIAQEIDALKAGADIAIASKHAKGARVAYPFIRIVASYGFTLFTRALFGMKLSDFQCGCKAFKKQAIQSLLPTIRTQGFLWDTEVLVKAQQKHYKIVELPARVKPDERRSKVRVFRDTWRMFKGLLTLKRELHGRKLAAQA
ncbi:glycosyltransferase [Candidatus Woesearchaeota archaeon]|nr:glycosyltransferase [Candidatus Woesearchaeota archaeon]